MHSITRQGGKLTALVRGRLNREEADTLVRDVESILREPGATGRKLIVDMSRVEYLSSSGLGALVRMFRAANDVKMEMVVCCGKAEIRSLIEIAGLDKLIKLIDLPDSE